MVVYLSNAFSLSMLETTPVSIDIVEVTTDEVKALLLEEGFISAVGHSSTAEIMSLKLGIEVPVNRVQVKLKKNDVIIVFQLLKRLEEGKVLSKEEIEKVPAKWFLVEVG